MNLWRIIKQWLSDILTPVYRGEMEIIRKKVWLRTSHLCWPGPACAYSVSFLAVRWTHIHFFLLMSVFVFGHTSPSSLSCFPPPLHSLPSSPLPSSLPPPRFFNWSGKTSSTQNSWSGTQVPFCVSCSLKALRWSREIGDLGYLEGHWKKQWEKHQIKIWRCLGLKPSSPGILLV